MEKNLYLLIYALDGLLNKVKISVGMFGLDKHKPNQEQVSESLGIEFGVFFLSTIYYHNKEKRFHVLLFISWIIGAMDDMVTISFKLKMVLSFLLSGAFIFFGTPINDGPILIGYIQKKLFFNERISLFIHKAVLFLITAFTFNSINLLAGINGLEITQAIILITVFQLLIIRGQLLPYNEKEKIKRTKEILYLYTINETALYLSVLMFFLNKYPATRFVGNSYTACMGGLISINILLNEFPIISFGAILIQFFNFLIGFHEIFQIFGHVREEARLPVFNETTGRLTMGKSKTFLNLLLHIKGEMNELNLLAYFTHIQLIYLVLYYIIRTFLLEFILLNNL